MPKNLDDIGIIDVNFDLHGYRDNCIINDSIKN